MTAMYLVDLLTSSPGGVVQGDYRGISLPEMRICAKHLRFCARRPIWPKIAVPCRNAHLLGGSRGANVCLWLQYVDCTGQWHVESLARRTSRSALRNGRCHMPVTVLGCGDVTFHRDEKGQV